jgi:hypothetical protein
LSCVGVSQWRVGGTGVLLLPAELLPREEEAMALRVTRVSRCGPARPVSPAGEGRSSDGDDKGGEGHPESAEGAPGTVGEAGGRTEEGERELDTSRVKVVEGGGRSA